MNLTLLAVTALPFVVSPGASFAITISSSLAGDKRAAVKVWVRTALGIFLVAAVAAFSGLGQLLAGSGPSRTVFRLIGGLVLVAIGISSLVRVVRPKQIAEQNPRPASQLVLWAFLALVSNVKALSLYVLVVPAIDGAGIDGLALFLTCAATHVTMLLIWLTLLGIIVNAVPVLAKSYRVRTALVLLTAWP